MFNIGPGELVAISMVALIVLGPERLPGAVRQVGRFFGELRRMSTGFQDEIRSAFDDAEIEQARREMEAQPVRKSPVADTATPIDAVSTEATPAPEPESTPESTASETPPEASSEVADLAEGPTDQSPSGDDPGRDAS
jgi:sec-independent protein translocase protein TatB